MPHAHVPGRTEFEVVFSNSVIEHVGDWAAQRRLAAEVRRVGRRYWVQTPNRHFPIEQHFMFPAFQYLPSSAQCQVARRWPLSFAKALGLGGEREATSLRVLSYEEMADLFRDAELVKERFLGLAKSLIAHTLTRP